MTSRLVRVFFLTLGVLGFAVTAAATTYCHNAGDGTFYFYNSTTGQGKWVSVKYLAFYDCDVAVGF